MIGPVCLLLSMLLCSVTADESSVQDNSTGAVHYFTGQPQDFMTSIMVARRFGKRKFKLEPTADGFVLLDATPKSPASCM